MFWLINNLALLSGGMLVQNISTFTFKEGLYSCVLNTSCHISYTYGIGNKDTIWMII